MSSSLFSSSSTKGTMVFDGAPQPQLASASSSSKSAKKDKASKRDVAPARPSSSSAGASSEKPKKRRAEAEAPADASPPGAPPDEPPKKKDKKKETDLPESSAAAAASAAAAEKPTRKQRAETDRAEQNARTIFVGNLPIDADADRISKHFARHGSVLTVRIRSAAPSDPKMPKKAAVITGQLDRGIRDSYNAYVVFKEARSVVAAVETNGQLFEGRHLRVDRVAGAGAGSSAPSAGENKRSVFLGNLPFNVQEEEVRQLFARCGAVENVRLVRDQATQHGKGFGYILFAEEGAVETALGLHEKLKLPGPEKKERLVRVFRCSQAKSNKRVREEAGKPSSAGKGGAAKGGGAGGKGGGGGKGGSGGKGGAKTAPFSKATPMGSGAKGGWLQRQRQRADHRAAKELKPKLSVHAKIKKERRDKVQRKREHKQAKRGGGRVAAGGVGKNKKQAAKGAKAAKGGKKPSKM